MFDFKIFESGWLNNIYGNILHGIEDLIVKEPLIRSIETRDDFIMRFRQYCHDLDPNDYVQDVSYLFRVFINSRGLENLKVNFAWIAEEILYASPKINIGIKSVREKSKNDGAFKYPGFYEFITKTSSVQNLAVSLQSKNNAEWKRFPSEHIFYTKVKSL